MSEADRLRWEARYRAPDLPVREPAPFLTGLHELLPRAGRALDVAGGAGGNAIWLAQRGLRVTICDISESALALAQRAAHAAGVELETQQVDLELEALPSGPWDLIVSFDHLERALFSRWPEVLAPGGLLVFAQPTRSNLERHAKPGSTHLLEDGELPGLLQGLELVRYEEGWFDDRHEARLLARRR